MTTFRNLTRLALVLALVGVGVAAPAQAQDAPEAQFGYVYFEAVVVNLPRYANLQRQLAQEVQTRQQTLQQEAATLQEEVARYERQASLLTEERWRGTRLRALAEALLGSFADGGERLRIEGPEVSLAPNASISMSMALHELATNALKHGALSGSGGTVRLSWAIEKGEEEERLNVTWKERGGPPVQAPDRKGFGRQMLERAIPLELGGEVEVDFAPTGLVCRMSFPTERTLSREPA